MNRNETFFSHGLIYYYHEKRVRPVNNGIYSQQTDTAELDDGTYLITNNYCDILTPLGFSVMDKYRAMFDGEYLGGSAKPVYEPNYDNLPSTPAPKIPLQLDLLDPGILEVTIPHLLIQSIPHPSNLEWHGLKIQSLTAKHNLDTFRTAKIQN